MISNGALSDSFRASNTFNSLSVNGRRLSRSSLMGMTTEIHGCDEGVMRNWNAGGSNTVGNSCRHSTEGVLEIQTERAHSSVMHRSTCDAKVGSFETKMIDEGSSLEQSRRKMISRTEGAMLCSVPSTINTWGLVTIARASSKRRIWLRVN